MPPTLSVIIPVWRDLARLPPLLALLRQSAPDAEVIVVLAEATPPMVEAVRSWGATGLAAGAPNRGRQLDLGAAAASGAWLLFHHADTDLTPAHLEALADLPFAEGVVGGAFYRKFDERHPHMRCCEPVERWHNRNFGALYGDQSIFARRDIFTSLGGFRGLPLMEDVDFSLRLRRAGRVLMLDPPIGSSPRKHLRQGPWRTTLMNLASLILYRLGMPPALLHSWYYRGASQDAVGAAPEPDGSLQSE